MINDDLELLRQYVRLRSEAAFTELVRRHVNLVYAAALRQVGQDTHLAQDVTQMVFTDLARKGRGLLGHANLLGWLYQATRYAASNVRRVEQRRKVRENEADVMGNPSCQSAEDAKREQLCTELDTAMQTLSASDQQVLLLRFFESKDLRSVGSVMGVSENAARMRVDRALEKLRGVLAQRGLSLSVAALVAALGSQAVISAPAGLVATVAGTAMLSAAAGGGLILNLSNLMHLPIMKIAASVLITAGVTVPVAWHQHQRASRLTSENEALVQKTAELDQLRAENQRLSQLQVNTVGLTGQQQAELLKLRGELNVLRRAQRQQPGAGQPQIAKLNPPPVPENAEPPVAKMEIDAGKMICMAARVYATGHGDQFPTSFDEMKAELEGATVNGKTITSEYLDRFEFYPQPRTISETEPDLILFREKTPRPQPDGQWLRVYTFADGSAQEVGSRDGRFEDYEKSHTATLVASQSSPK